MKLYKSKVWLRKKYVEERLNIVEIAELCDCSPTTVYTWLLKYEFIRDPRKKTR